MRKTRLLASLFLFTAVASAAVREDVKEVSKTVDLDAGGRVAIDTYKGSIDVQPWDKSWVEIHARIEPDEGFPSSDKDSVQDTEIRIEGSKDSVRIKTDYSRLKRGWFGGVRQPLVHYRIKMPRTARLDIKDYKSKAEVSGLRSDVRIETYKGVVMVNDLGGSLELKTYKGEARVEFTNLARESRLETYKGEIEISLPDDQGFELQSELGRRAEIDSSFRLMTPARSRKSRDKHFATAVNGGGPKLLLKSYKGEFRLRRI